MATTPFPSILLSMQLKPIRSGDIVEIVAPASACRPQELKNGVAALRALGFIPRLPKDIFAKSVKENIPTYLAAKQLAEKRINDIGKVKINY